MSWRDNFNGSHARSELHHGLHRRPFSQLIGFLSGKIVANVASRLHAMRLVMICDDHHDPLPAYLKAKKHETLRCA